MISTDSIVSWDGLMRRRFWQHPAQELVITRTMKDMKIKDVKENGNLDQ
jgi:hypothetical protein